MLHKILAAVGCFLILATNVAANGVPFFDYGNHEKLAGKILELYKLEGNYSVMRRNLAYYLQNYLSHKDVLRSRLSFNKEQLVKTVFQDNFWSQKLERDLDSPYADEDFGSYLVELQTEMDAFVDYLNFMNQSNQDIKLYLYGSFAKGRIGARSSVDLMIGSKDKIMLEKIEKGPYSESHVNFKGHVNVISTNFEPECILEPLREVTLKQLKDMGGLYRNILNELGFDLERKGGSASIVKIGSPRSYIEFNPIEDRIYYLQSKLKDLNKDIQDAWLLLKEERSKETDSLKASFLRRMDSLYGKMREVEHDMVLIQGNIMDDRLKRIQSVIQKESYERMKRYRLDTLMGFVRINLKRLDKQREILKNI
jgi:hypothetical protein